MRVNLESRMKLEAGVFMRSSGASAATCCSYKNQVQLDPSEAVLLALPPLTDAAWSPLHA